MTEKARNMAVGLTVIVALMLFGGMILLFTGLPWFLQGGYEVKIAAPSTHDAHTGDGIHLSGMRIGRVTDIVFTDPSRPYDGVTITARIDSEIELPGNVQAFFFTRGLVGSAYIELKAEGPPRLDPATGQPLESFPTDGSLTMSSVHVGSGMVPAELTDAMKSLTNLADNINQLIAPSLPGRPEAAGEPQPASAPRQPPGLKGTIEKLNLALDAMTAVLGDAENQRNLKTSLANLAAATAAARETMVELKNFAVQARGTAEDFSKLAARSQQRVDDLTGKIIDTAEKVSQLMATANRVATRIEAGEGTAGMLLSDPQLYQSFLEATRQMNNLLSEFRQLVEAWKRGGVEIKLK